MNSKLLELASPILDFGRVNRKTAHQDGVMFESDTDHTVMLGIIGSSLASKMYPDLNVGKVAEFALIHDLVEVHTGDTPTLLGVGEEFFKDKLNREVLAIQKIKDAFGDTLPWIHETIEAYERLDTKEARFVKTVDKILPKFTVLLNQGKGFRNHPGITKKEVQKTFAIQREKLKKIAHDMPELIILWEYFMQQELKLIKE